MDEHLIAAARAVKRRRRLAFPTLWLFTDSKRLPDPLPAIAALPRGISGVVFRHDGAAGRADLGRRIAALCRVRGIALVVAGTRAGDWRLAAALHAGVHLRGGAMPRTRYRGPIVTASAHGRADLIAAARAGVDLVFLSPAFVTASHPGAAPLGAVRWAGLARRSKIPVLALGGLDGRKQRRLGVFCAGTGAIGALSCREKIV
ncbi:MAG TPA: thiamine phosphate synthase [Acidiphilium sp.]